MIVLGNASDLDLNGTVRRISAIYLDPQLGAAPAAPVVPRKVFREVGVDPARLDALAGFYALSPQVGIAFTKENGGLMAKGTGWPELPVFAYGERAFFAKAIDARFTFDPPGPDGIVAGGVLHQSGATRLQSAPRGSVALDVKDKDTFAAGFPFGDLGYQCGAQDGCTGFTVGTERARKVRFTRVALTSGR